MSTDEKVEDYEARIAAIHEERRKLSLRIEALDEAIIESECEMDDLREEEDYIKERLSELKLPQFGGQAC